VYFFTRIPNLQEYWGCLDSDQRYWRYTIWVRFRFWIWNQWIDRRALSKMAWKILCSTHLCMVTFWVFLLVYGISPNPVTRSPMNHFQDTEFNNLEVVAWVDSRIFCPRSGSWSRSELSSRLGPKIVDAILTHQVTTQMTSFKPFYSTRDALSTDFKFKTWIELISYIANISGQNQDTLNILANSESSWKNTLWGTNFVR